MLAAALHSHTRREHIHEVTLFTHATSYTLSSDQLATVFALVNATSMARSHATALKSGIQFIRFHAGVPGVVVVVVWTGANTVCADDYTRLWRV